MKSDNISEIIRIVSNLSVALPLFIYLTRFKHAPRRVHIIGALIIVSGLCDLAGFMLFKEQQSTAILFNTYYAVLFFLLSWFYYEILFISSRRVVVLIGFAVYLQSLFLVTAYVQPLSEYQTLMWIITAITMIVYSIAYVFYSLSIPPNINLLYYGPAWINAGVLIYFMLNLFLFVMSKHMLTNENPELSALIWSFHNLNNIVKNILFGIGIYFYKRKNIDFSASTERSLQEPVTKEDLYTEPLPARKEDVLSN